MTLPIHRRHRVASWPYPPGPVSAANDDTLDPQKLSQWTEFHEYVERLAEEDRALFDLLWYQGLTMADASELLCIPLRTLGRRWKTVRVRLYRDLLCDSADESGEACPD